MLALLDASVRCRESKSRKSNRRARAISAATRRLTLRGEPLEDRRLMAVDVILEWNSVLLEANARDHALAAPQQGGPILTARAFAIASAAMYDAYNSINKIGDSYLVSASGVKGANVDAAVAQAAYTTLTALYPAQRALFSQALVDTLA